MGKGWGWDDLEAWDCIYMLLVMVGLAVKSCLTLSDPMDGCPPASSVFGIS